MMAEENSVRRDEMESRLLAAIAQLEGSPRGRRALYTLAEWLATSGWGLDGANQESIQVVIQSAWGPYRGTAFDMIRRAMHSKQGNDAKPTTDHTEDTDR